jgi:chromosome partitioning protein
MGAFMGLWTRRVFVRVVVLSRKGGVGKCLGAETEVVDPRTGDMRTLAEFVAHAECAEVFSLEGSRRVRARPVAEKIRSGVKDCVRVTFASGRTLTATPNHPLLMADGWRAVEDIEVGETAALAARIPFPREPVEISDAEVDLLAVLLAEGGTTTRGVRFSTTDPAVLRRAGRAASALGMKATRVAGSECAYRLTGKSDLGAHDGTVDGLCRCGCGAPVGIAARNFHRRGLVGGRALSHAVGHGGRTGLAPAFVRRHGLEGMKAKEKRMPKVAFRLGQRQLARFLELFFMCDGYVDKRHGPRVTLASEELVRGIQHLLLRFGVQSSVHPKEKVSGGRRFLAWELVVYAKYRSAFRASMPLWGKKARRLQALCAVRGTPNVGAPSLPLALEESLRGATRKHEGPSGAGGATLVEVGKSLGYGHRMRFAEIKHRSGRIARRPFAGLCGTFGLEEEHSWLYDPDSEIFWDAVASVVPIGKRPVYDLSVEPTRCFVAQDVIVHNSTTAIHLGGYLAGVSGGEEDVLLVDTDPSRNALRWSKRGRLPFRVVGEDEVDAEPAMAREARHLIVDMRGSPSAEEIEDAMRLAEVMVIPIMPSGLALDTLLQTRRDLRRLGREDRYRVLLTAVPPWPYRRGPQARAQLEELGIPLFGVDIRRLEAFEAAADEGVLVRDLPDRRASRGWEDYRQMGEELVEWVMALRTPDLRAAGSGGGAR